MTTSSTYPTAVAAQPRTAVRAAPRAAHPVSARATTATARTAAQGRGGLPAPAPIRLTRRGRVVAVVVSVLVLLAIVVFAGRSTAQAGDDASTVVPGTVSLVVTPGMSLWQVAGRIAPNVDPRAVVTAIRDLNHLGTRPIVPGQVLLVPAYAGT